MRDSRRSGIVLAIGLCATAIAVIVAAFLTDSHAPEDRRNALFKAIAGTVVADLHP